MKKHQKAALDSVMEATKGALMVRAMKYLKQKPTGEQGVDISQPPLIEDGEGETEVGDKEVSLLSDDDRKLAGGEQLTEEDVEALRKLLK